MRVLGRNFNGLEIQKKRITAIPGKGHDDALYTLCDALSGRHVKGHLIPWGNAHKPHTFLSNASAKGDLRV